MAEKRTLKKVQEIGLNDTDDLVDSSDENELIKNFIERATKRRCRKQISELNSKITGYDRVIEKLEKEIAAYKEKESENEKLNKEVNYLKKENNELKKENETLMDKNEILRRNLEKYDSFIGKTLNMITSLKQDN